MKTRLKAKELAKLEALLDTGDPDFVALVDIESRLVEQFNPNRVADDLSNLTPAQRGFYVSWWLEGEVNNGGFNQFLLNKGPAYAREALAFCESRGLDEIADLLRRAIAALPGGVLPETYDELELILGNDSHGDEEGPIDQAHAALDDIFFENNLDERLMLERLRFVREHADEFFDSDAAADDPSQAPVPTDVDALDVVELVMAIEGAFGIAIANADAERFATVGDVIDHVAAHADRTKWDPAAIDDRVRALAAEVLGMRAAHIHRSSSGHRSTLAQANRLRIFERLRSLIPAFICAICGSSSSSCGSAALCAPSATSALNPPASAATPRTAPPPPSHPPCSTA